MHSSPYDLLAIGGGINGAGIARDAAGRGLSVLLAEQDDLAAATSQWSTRLIHGGLRYLDYYEFRLVAESLAEREVLLANAPHLVEPLAFVLPHEPHLRPAWMIGAGLFLYDHIGGRRTLPKSFGVNLAGSRWSAGLKPRFRKGFVYADARRVVANVLDVAAHGGEVRTRTRVTGARRDEGLWRVALRTADGTDGEIAAGAIVNAAGPWVKRVLDSVRPEPPGESSVRHVKGSHVVVPRVHAEAHAYILQNADERIVFVIPFENDHSLIATTDVPVDDCERPEISADGVDYLIKLANAYLDRPLTPYDVVRSFSGVRPLYDDGSSDPSAITRDYVPKLDAPPGGPGAERAPVLSLFGGKITTYRKLAEHALSELAPYLPAMKPAWTLAAPLPGGDLPRRDRNAWMTELCCGYPQLPAPLLRAIGTRHGTRAARVLGDAKSPAGLGRDFGAHLTEREIDCLVAEERARTADDVLWRCTKRGLPMTPVERVAVAEHMPWCA